MNHDDDATTSFVHFLSQHGSAWFAAELKHFLDLRDVVRLDTAVSAARTFHTTAWLDVLRVLSVEQLSAHPLDLPALRWVTSRGVPITTFKWQDRTDRRALTMGDVVPFLNANQQITELDICVTQPGGRAVCPLLESASAPTFDTLARYGRLLKRLCLYSSYAFSTGPRHISARGMATLVAHCPALESFTYNGLFVGDTDQTALFNALQTCPVLRELSLAQVECVTAPAVGSLQLPSLRHLIFNFGGGTAQASLRVPTASFAATLSGLHFLREITVVRASAVAEPIVAIATAPCARTALEVLDVASERARSADDEGEAVRALARCPALRSVKLSWHGAVGLSFAGLDAIAAGGWSRGHVDVLYVSADLVSSESVATLADAVPSLREVVVHEDLHFDRGLLRAVHAAHPHPHPRVAVRYVYCSYQPPR